MIRRRIVQPLAIGDQHAEQRAQFQQLMPIPVVAGEPRRIQAHYQPGLAETNFRDQRLETAPLAAGGAGFSEIVVDDVNPLARPAEQHGALDQPILQLRAFLMMTDLPR